jgi:hypothetical protein
MHTNDPLTGRPAPSAARAFDSMISSPPSQCNQCTEHSLRIFDLETRLTLAKHQAQMEFDKASNTSNLVKQVSILDDKVSSLTANFLHHDKVSICALAVVFL